MAFGPSAWSVAAMALEEQPDGRGAGRNTEIFGILDNMAKALGKVGCLIHSEAGPFAKRSCSPFVTECFFFLQNATRIVRVRPS